MKPDSRNVVARHQVAMMVAEAWAVLRMDAAPRSRMERAMMGGGGEVGRADRSWLVAPGGRSPRNHGGMTHRAAEPLGSLRVAAPNSAREAPLVGHLLPGRVGRRRHSFGLP